MHWYFVNIIMYTAANITMLTFFCSTSQLVPYITTSNNWCSCGHYNVSLAIVLHYNLQGHNTAANITMLTCLYSHHNWYPPSQLAMTGTPVDIIMFCSQLSCITTCMVIILLQKSQLQCHLAVSHM
jgi:hypothetical protein